MNCDQVAELLEEYGLDVLADGDAAAVREHLDGCRRHDTELSDIRAVADALAVAAPDGDPPPALRARLLDAFAAESAEPAAVGSGEPRPIVPPRLLNNRRVAWWPAAVAALLVAAIGLGAWSLVLQISDGGSNQTNVEFSGEFGEGRLVYLEDEQIALLDMSLPELESGRVYQAWGMFADETLSLGVIEPRGTFAFSHDLSTAVAVGLSVEPLGGSDQPTTAPFLIANLD